MNLEDKQFIFEHFSQLKKLNKDYSLFKQTVVNIKSHNKQNMNTHTFKPKKGLKFFPAFGQLFSIDKCPLHNECKTYSLTLCPNTS